jgi:hypothetical protein
MIWRLSLQQLISICYYSKPTMGNVHVPKNEKSGMSSSSLLDKSSRQVEMFTKAKSTRLVKFLLVISKVLSLRGEYPNGESVAGLLSIILQTRSGLCVSSQVHP